MLDDKTLPYSYTVSSGAANKRDNKCSSTYQNASSPAPFPLTPVLLDASLRPHRICLDCSTLRPDCSCSSAYMDTPICIACSTPRPDCSCWLACRDAPRLAPSSLSPSLVSAALQLSFIGPLSYMLGLACPYCLKSSYALNQILSFSFSSLFRTDRRPQLYSLFSISIRLHYISGKLTLLTISLSLIVV